MEIAINILAIVAIALSLILIITFISFIAAAKKFIGNLDRNVHKITKDIHTIKDQSSVFIDDVGTFFRRANNIAETLEDMSDPALESIQNIKIASDEAKSIVSIAKNKTEELTHGLRSVTDSIYEAYMRVVQPVQRVVRAVTNAVETVERIKHALRKNK